MLVLDKDSISVSSLYINPPRGTAVYTHEDKRGRYQRGDWFTHLHGERKRGESRCAARLETLA